MTHVIVSDRAHRERMLEGLTRMKSAAYAHEAFRRLVDFAQVDGFRSCTIGGVEFFATSTTTVRDLERAFSRKMLALRQV